MYKFEQVSSDDHQMSLAGGRASARAGEGVSQRCHVCGGGGGAGIRPCTVSSNASCVMVYGNTPLVAT